MELSKMKYNQLKEIILVALTYRVSFKNLSKLCSTTLDDIELAFLQMNDFSHSLKFLDLETRDEDLVDEKVAYCKAKEYFNKRNELYKELNNCSKYIQLLGDSSRAEYYHKIKNEIKKEIEQLHSLIDDSLIHSTIGKNPLTSVEKDEIAKFRLKYYLSLNECSNILNRKKDTIISFEEQLALKNQIYSEKRTKLLDYYTSISKKVIHKWLLKK